MILDTLEKHKFRTIGSSATLLEYWILEVRLIRKQKAAFLRENEDLSYDANLTENIYTTFKQSSSHLTFTGELLAGDGSLENPQDENTKLMRATSFPYSNSDLLKWWMTQKARFRALSKVAKDVIAMQASSFAKKVLFRTQEDSLAIVPLVSPIRQSRLLCCSGHGHSSILLSPLKRFLLPEIAGSMVGGDVLITYFYEFYIRFSANVYCVNFDTSIESAYANLSLHEK